MTGPLPALLLGHTEPYLPKSTFSVVDSILRWSPIFLPPAAYNLYNCLPLSVGRTCEYNRLSYCNCYVIWQKEFPRFNEFLDVMSLS